MHRLEVDTASVSWGSIFGGVVTVLSVSVLLSMLVSWLGIGMIEPQTDDPFAGVGTTFGISSAIALIISLAAGGFVAGRLAGASGVIHGFLTWGLALLTATVLTVMAASSAVQTAGSLLGTAGSVTGYAISGAGSAVGTAGSAVREAVEGVVGELDTDGDGIDLDTLQTDLAEILENTEIEGLQPENLRTQLSGAGQDVRDATGELVRSPGDYEEILSGLLTSLQTRADDVVGEIDRDAAVDALENSTEMTRFEAERAVDTAIARLEEARAQVEQRVADIRVTVETGQQRLAELQAQLVEQADAAAQAASRVSMWAFFAALIGALTASAAGFAGSRSRDY